MQTKLSSKGQVVLPGPIRRRLGLQIGDPLEASIEGGRVVLTPRYRRKRWKIIEDPITGIPVLRPTADAPELTSREVREILSNFP